MKRHGPAGFFRFLLQAGAITTDLAQAVPTVPHWRLSGLPQLMKAADVEYLLHSCDRQTAQGQRDDAILLLLARLGLRAGAVVALTLDDLDWEAGALLVRGKAHVKIDSRCPMRLARRSSPICVQEETTKHNASGLSPDASPPPWMRQESRPLYDRGASFGPRRACARAQGRPSPAPCAGDSAASTTARRWSTSVRWCDTSMLETTRIYAKVDQPALRAGVALARR